MVGLPGAALASALGFEAQSYVGWGKVKGRLQATGIKAEVANLKSKAAEIAISLQVADTIAAIPSYAALRTPSLKRYEPYFSVKREQENLEAVLERMKLRLVQEQVEEQIRAKNGQAYGEVETPTVANDCFAWCEEALDWESPTGPGRRRGVGECQDNPRFACGFGDRSCGHQRGVKGFDPGIACLFFFRGFTLPSR